MKWDVCQSLAMRGVWQRTSIGPDPNKSKKVDELQLTRQMADLTKPGQSGDQAALQVIHYPQIVISEPSPNYYPQIIISELSSPLPFPNYHSQIAITELSSPNFISELSSPNYY